MPLFGKKDKDKAAVADKKGLLPTPAQTLQKSLQILKDGSTLEKYNAGRRATPLHFSFDPFTLLISYVTTKGKPPVQIDVAEVQEIRTGEQALSCKEFKLSNDFAKAKTSKFVISILHGNEFRLKQLCLVVKTQEEYLAWTDGIWSHVRLSAPDLYTTHRMTERWLWKNWKLMEGETKQSLSLKDIKMWLTRINLKLGNKECKDLFTVVDKYKNQLIGFPEFTQLYHIMGEAPVLEEIFNKYHNAGHMTLDQVVRFMAEELGEKLSKEQTMDIIRNYSGSPEPSIRLAQFVEYLHSAENQLRNAAHDEIFQDMTRPLAHYFINSSHNTYLMGDQFRSESSVEAYVRSLRWGCRCIEIDCWDGASNDPVVYHGHTLTSKIKFRDVLAVVREHAFVASEYPLILSIENHCSLPQQEVMAKSFLETFGDMLVTQPLNPKEEAYPSPEQLKHRVIIKHKKLDDGSTEVTLNSNKTDDDLSSSIKNGYLSLEDRVDGSWTKHYFVLTESKITYAETHDEESEEPAEEEDSQIAESELHYGEAWFHGKLKGGRVVAETLLKGYVNTLPASQQEGTFLVRESDTFPGEFSLSFWRNGIPNHCRIRCKSGKYFLTDQISFVNLFELIEYYRREPLRSAQFTMTLTEAVPQPAPHEDKKWFHKSLSRADAEEMLKRIRSDGAYLVRESETAQQSYAISFRAEDKIKHCRIRKEGRMYCIGDAEFDSLVKLVEYYEKHPLYRKMKLRYPVDAALIERQGEEPDDPIYNSDDLYQMPNAFCPPSGGGDSAAAAEPAAKSTNVTCRALYAYRATQPDELSFPKDAIITNIIKKDGGWWLGNYGGIEGGWLPSNYVENIDHDSMAQEDREDSENPLGSLEKAVMDIDGLRVEPRVSTPAQRLIFRIIDSKGHYVDVGAETEDEMREWAKAITDAANERRLHTTQQKSIQKKMRIAKQLSDLVFYSQSVVFTSFEASKQTPYYVMSSFVERKAYQLAMERGGFPREFVDYCKRQLARAYPNGKRVDSSNFDPQILWNIGMQLVALNFQTPDRPMWLNHGRFLENGGCGLVLKPDIMLAPDSVFDPFNHKTYVKSAVNLKLRIISARHLIKPGKGVASPFVEVEIIGVDGDRSKYRTRVINDNGFNPVWNETVSFAVGMPSLAAIGFTVFDEDMFGDANAIGQAVFPIGEASDLSIRQGYRSVQLLNTFSEPLELSSLLVEIRLAHGTEGEVEQDAYQSLQELRAQVRRRLADRNQLIKEKVQATKNQQEFDKSKDEQLSKINENLRELETKLIPLEMAAEQPSQPPGHDTRI